MLVAEVEIVAVREMADRDSNKVSHKDFSGSDHGNEQLLEFSNSEVCDETDKEPNLDRENTPYELLPFYSIVRASPI